MGTGFPTPGRTVRFYPRKQSGTLKLSPMSLESQILNVNDQSGMIHMLDSREQQFSNKYVNVKFWMCFFKTRRHQYTSGN